MTREEFLIQLPTLTKNYQPAPDVRERIAKVTLLMLIGPSGVGKTTLIKQSGLHFVPSDTTRDIRPGEQEGVDMYFRTDYDHVVADIKAGRFVQIAPFATGDLYATKDTSYPTSGIAAMPVMADVIQVFRKLGFAKTISAFIVPPTYEEWMRRMKPHVTNDEQLKRRLKEAEKSFTFALNDHDTHFILNDEVAKAEMQLKNIITGEAEVLREIKAQQIAASLLHQLQAGSPMV